LQALKERTKAVETQLGKIAASQTLILAMFAGRPKPKPVKELKTMRVEDNEGPDKLDYSNAPTPEYAVEDLVKMITLKNPHIEGGNKKCAKKILIKLL
jgi:hypothetical protein